MQSGYGEPDLQPFMVDSCSSFLSISHDMNSPQLYQQQKQHQHQHQHINFIHPANQAPATQHFFLHHQYHGLPFVQQQQQQRRLHQELGLGEQPEAGSPPPKIICGELGVPPPRFVKTDFSLGVNEAGGGGREAEFNGEVAVAVEDCSDYRTIARWHQQPREEEESAIKEPLWKRLDMEYMSRNSKRNKEKLEALTRQGTNEEGKTSGNYGLFSELEAIYSNRSSNGCSAGSNQAGSNSALTGDNTGPVAACRADHGSETSTREEASRKKLQKKSKWKKQMSSIAGFLQEIVKQLMDHQEGLNCKFLEVMEKKEREKAEREEAWRHQETARLNQEAAARAQEQALASSREAAIISYLEKISGENLRLPSKTQLYNHATNISNEGLITDMMEAVPNKDGNGKMDKIDGNLDGMNGRRWPRMEVQALIRIRIGLEPKFQEPGLKAPLWEEVSASMAAMGYQRSSKRCKEKWENINKYFRKTKDNIKKRPRRSKTCPYFHQLDQLYSIHGKKTYVPANQSETALTDGYELMDPIVVASAQPNSVDFVEEQSFKYSEMVVAAVQNDDQCNELNARQVLLQLQEELVNEEEDQDHDDEDDENGEEENEERD